MDSHCLYESLASQHTLDDQHKEQIVQLAAFAKMFSSMQPTDATMTTFQPIASSDFWSAGKACEHAKDAAHAAVPFDSPFDQSLGSPASTRDFHDSPLNKYDFDFAANIDAPLFPDHGTQSSSHNDNLLSGLPLFGNELALSQTLLTTAKSSGLSDYSASQSQIPQTVGDFSFDASTRGPINFDVTDAVTASLPEQSLIAQAISPFEPHSSQQSINEKSQDGAYFDHFSEASASFVRECTLLSKKHGVDALQRALRGVGWDVNDDLAANIISSAAASRSPSPLADSVSASTPSSSPRSSVSPMALPAAVAFKQSTNRKSRSSAQASPRDAFAGSEGHHHAKRFVCPDCHKQFDRAFNLRTHSLTHVKPDDREKPYVCPWDSCNKPFSRKYDAERHYRTVHARRGEVATPAQVDAALSGLHGISSSVTMKPSSFSSEVNLTNG